MEPKIGHLKSDHRLGSCYLKGLAGDAINVILAAAGANLRKLLRAIAPPLIDWLTRWLTLAIASQDRRCQWGMAI